MSSFVIPLLDHYRSRNGGENTGTCNMNLFGTPKYFNMITKLILITAVSHIWDYDTDDFKIGIFPPEMHSVETGNG